MNTGIVTSVQSLPRSPSPRGHHPGLFGPGPNELSRCCRNEFAVREGIANGTMPAKLRSSAIDIRGALATGPGPFGCAGRGCVPSSRGAEVARSSAKNRRRGGDSSSATSARYVSSPSPNARSPVLLKQEGLPFSAPTISDCGRGLRDFFCFGPTEIRHATARSGECADRLPPPARSPAAGAVKWAAPLRECHAFSNTSSRLLDRGNPAVPAPV